MREIFPIMQGTMLRGIPWGMVAPLEERAQKNHSQTLDRLAERKGLEPTEMLKLLNDEDLFPYKSDPDAEQKIMVMILEFLNKE